MLRGAVFVMCPGFEHVSVAVGTDIITPFHDIKLTGTDIWVDNSVNENSAFCPSVFITSLSVWIPSGNRKRPNAKEAGSTNFDAAAAW